MKMEKEQQGHYLNGKLQGEWILMMQTVTS
jgi:hypothetical protein